MPSSLSSHPSLSIPALGAFQLQLTPLNSTPTFARIERPSVLVRARRDFDDDLASARAASARAAAAAALASVVAAASIHLARATPPAIAAAASASEASGYVGVGLEVYVAPDVYPTVIEFLPTKTSGPAHDAGVRINDKIAAVNGAETRAMRSLADVASALRGGGGETDCRLLPIQYAPVRASIVVS